MFDQRNVLDREVLREIDTKYGDFVLGPPIKKRVSLAEDMAAQRPCRNEDYEAMTKNFLQRIKYEQEISTKTSTERIRPPP